jgi:cytochrome c-type biogenesis protein CcmF
MIGPLGRAALLLGLLSCLFGIITVVAGIRARDQRLLKTAGRYSWLAFAGAAGAFALMEYALITRDFSLAYVQQVGSHATPTLYNITAIWSALEGSILLWVLVLATCTVAVALRFRRRLGDELVGWALVVMFAVGLFFFALSFGPANPFAAGASPMAPAPTHCSRTMCWWSSTHPSCISATWD